MQTVCASAQFQFRLRGWRSHCTIACTRYDSPFILVHITKMSMYGPLLQLVENLECRNCIAVTSACDDLTGTCLSPIAQLASRASGVYYLSDLDGRGLASSVIFENVIRQTCMPGTPIASLGISDSTLAFLRTTCGARYRQVRRAITITMSSDERRLRQRVLGYSCKWRERVGPRSLLMLHRGYKVCLEGVWRVDEWRESLGRSLSHMCRGGHPGRSP